MEIAVLINENKATSGFDNNGIILIYEKINCEWVVKRQMVYNKEDLMNVTVFHQKIKEIGKWMNDCKILVVNRIRGVHYVAFEEFQISMLEIKGNPENFLDDIVECVNHRRTEEAIPIEHKGIFESQPGMFYTDLRDVMNGKTSYNSRQILQPFLKNETFRMLEIICDHVPKWLEKEQLELKVHLTVESYKKCMKVKVYQQ